ncbi:hypothetical protein ABNF65_06555 [Paenibacillus larvae]
MREMVIQFSTEGERFRELDESKSYYLQEAEEILLNLRHRLQNQDRDIKPKRFGFYMDGQYLLDSMIYFSDTQSIEQQIQNRFKETELWPDEIRHKTINQLKEYSAKEKEAFLNQEFRAFAYLMRDTFESKVDFLFSLQQLQQLFQGVYAKISNGFFSQLEDIVLSILESYHNLVDYYGLVTGNYKEIQKAKEDWFGDAENFTQFTRLVTANYFSVKQSKLKVIKANHPTYQLFQDYLFEYRAQSNFQLALDLHKEVDQRLIRRWNEVLMLGNILHDDDSVGLWVIELVLQDFFKEEMKRTDLTEEEEQLCEKISRVEKRF